MESNGVGGMDEPIADERTKYVRINAADGFLFVDSEILALSSRVLKAQFASGLERDKYVVNLPSIRLDVFKETIYAWFFKELQTGFDWVVLDTLEKYEWPTLSELYCVVDQYEWKFKNYILHFADLNFKSAVARLKGKSKCDEFQPEFAYAIFPHMEFFLIVGDERWIVDWLDAFGGVVLPYYKKHLNKMIEEAQAPPPLVAKEYYPTVDDDTSDLPEIVRENIRDVRTMLLAHLERFFATVPLAVVEPLIRFIAAHSWLFDSWTAWEDYAFEDYAGTVASILLDRPKFAQKYPIYARCRKAFLGALTADEALTRAADGEQPFAKLCEDYMYCHVDETIAAIDGPLDYGITVYFGNLRLLKRAALARNFF